MYCGNEDPMDDVILRVLTRLTHMSKEEIEEWVANDPTLPGNIETLKNNPPSPK